MLRIWVVIAALSLLAAAGAARAAPIPCSDISMAQRFVAKLKPGPNTRAAERHLAAAKRAKSSAACSRELRQVDVYARRSLAADRKTVAARSHKHAPKKVAARHATARHKAAHASPARVVQCADPLHQNRPGGSDYHGPPVAGCG